MQASRPVRLLSLWLGLLVVASSAGAMTFSVVEDPCGGGNARFCAPRIFGVGAIEPGDAARLRAAAGRAFTAYSGVTLSSSGGDLAAGLLLGAEIRRLRLDTYAQTSLQSWKYNPDRKERMPTMVDARIGCYSACAYAFLGGVTRNVLSGARLGFHQFTLPASPPGAEQIAQVGMTELRDYIVRMGVDGELLSIASTTPATQVRLLTEAETIPLRVDNTQPVARPWEVRVGQDGTPVLFTSTTLPDGRELASISLTLEPNGESDQWGSD